MPLPSNVPVSGAKPANVSQTVKAWGAQLADRAKAEAEKQLKVGQHDPALKDGYDPDDRARAADAADDARSAHEPPPGYAGPQRHAADDEFYADLEQCDAVLLRHWERGNGSTPISIQQLREMVASMSDAERSQLEARGYTTATHPVTRQRGMLEVRRAQATWKPETDATDPEFERHAEEPDPGDLEQARTHAGIGGLGHGDFMRAFPNAGHNPLHNGIVSHLGEYPGSSHFDVAEALGADPEAVGQAMAELRNANVLHHDHDIGHDSGWYVKKRAGEGQQRHAFSSADGTEEEQTFRWFADDLEAQREKERRDRQRTQQRTNPTMSASIDKHGDVRPDHFFAMMTKDGVIHIHHGTRQEAEQHYFGTRQLPPPDLLRIGLGRAKSHGEAIAALRSWYDDPKLPEVKGVKDYLTGESRHAEDSAERHAWDTKSGTERHSMGYTPQHHRILEALDESPGLSHRELAETLGMHPRDAATVLEDLIEQGDVIRKGNRHFTPDPTDPTLLPPSDDREMGSVHDRHTVAPPGYEHILRRLGDRPDAHSIAWAMHERDRAERQRHAASLTSIDFVPGCYSRNLRILDAIADGKYRADRPVIERAADDALADLSRSFESGDAVGDAWRHVIEAARKDALASVNRHASVLRHTILPEITMATLDRYGAYPKGDQRNKWHEQDTKDALKGANDLMPELKRRIAAADAQKRIESSRANRASENTSEASRRKADYGDDNPEGLGKSRNRGFFVRSTPPKDKHSELTDSVAGDRLEADADKAAKRMDPDSDDLAGLDPDKHFFERLAELDRHADFSRDIRGKIADPRSRVLANLTHEIGRGSDSFPFGVMEGEINDRERDPHDPGLQPPPGFDPATETFTKAPYPLSKGGRNPRSGLNSHLKSGIDAAEANRRLEMAKSPAGQRQRPPVPTNIAEAQFLMQNARSDQLKAKDLWPEGQAG